MNADPEDKEFSVLADMYYSARMVETRCFTVMHFERFKRRQNRPHHEAAAVKDWENAQRETADRLYLLENWLGNH